MKDKVCHSTLLQKLRVGRVRAVLYEIIADCLQCRTEVVQMNKQTPSEQDANSGVSQGSHLDRLFFVIYILYIPEIMDARFKWFGIVYGL